MANVICYECYPTDRQKGLRVEFRELACAHRVTVNQAAFAARRARVGVFVCASSIRISTPRRTIKNVYLKFARVCGARILSSNHSGIVCPAKWHTHTRERVVNDHEIFSRSQPPPSCVCLWRGRRRHGSGNSVTRCKLEITSAPHAARLCMLAQGALSAQKGYFLQALTREGC